VPSKKPIGEIHFSHVDFTYPSRDETKVLTDFSLTLLPNQTTAVVGRSGSGKSTIALLMMRLYDPQMGSVYLDGVDLRTINPQWLRMNIGAVSQEPVLFSGSIRTNILYGMNEGEPDPEGKLQQAVRDSNVIEFTKNLPDGLETIVGQRGMLLSGGQKQRVAIARALIKVGADTYIYRYTDIYQSKTLNRDRYYILCWSSLRIPLFLCWTRQQVP